LQVWYQSVGHPRLSSYVKGHNWLSHTGEYLMFPPDEWEFKGGARHYVESIDEVKIIGSSHSDQMQS
jgi:tRNA wybutosine-synthesizing protein 1